MITKGIKLKLGHYIDYKALRSINPIAARKVFLDYRKSNRGNVSNGAKIGADPKKLEQR